MSPGQKGMEVCNQERNFETTKRNVDVKRKI